MAATATAASSIRKSIYGLKNAVIPERRGQRWDDNEVLQLLTEVRKKISIKDIALNHQRTVTAINLRLRSLAADYYFYENRSIKDIQKFTGLTPIEIKNAIALRRIKDAEYEMSKTTILESDDTNNSEIQIESPVVNLTEDIKESTSEEPTAKDMMMVLINLQAKMKGLEKPNPTICDMMEIVKDIEMRMDTLLTKNQ